ncbi:MAG: LacI family transcriptional regulator [Firmicutes bacterium]|nr:LacI family transcriptional regulator [Bacillota bacterium]
MKPTMEEVAELAKVSRATVSRVLSDSTNVSPEKRRLVLEAVKQLGYEPLKQTNVRVPIAVHISSSPDWTKFYEKILEGIEQAASAEKLLIQDDLGQAKGLILLGNAAIKPSNVPVVVVDGLLEEEDYSLISIDERKAMLEAIQLLVKYGHRQIAFLNGPEHDIIRQERLRGYKLGILCARLPVNEALIQVATNWDRQSGYQATLQLLEQASPTALVAASSELALGAYQAIVDQGLKIPKDISLVGFDDLELTKELTPPMSRIDVSLVSMGKWAATLLKSLIDDEGRSPVRLNVPAVIRQTSSIGRAKH